tara:strand:+ start:914 stop:1597 length:684 start_codon:yes stop_codon:yes gene_type:complete
MAQVTATAHWDVDAIYAWLSGYQRQLPFVQMRAINDIAFHLKKRSLPGGAKAAFDQPTAFTSSAATWRVKKATKSNLEAFVFPEAKREPYLRANITGGQRGVKPFEAAFKGAGVGSSPADQFFPTNFARRNSKGNVRKATLDKIIQDAKAGATGRLSYFIGKPRNSSKPYGIYRRMARKIRPLYLPAVRPMQYKAIYDIGGIADKVISRQYQGLFEKYLQQAIKTAK